MGMVGYIGFAILLVLIGFVFWEANRPVECFFTASIANGAS